MGSKGSGAIVALVLALILSNLGIIPTAAPVWDAVWSYVVPLSLPLLLMQCNVRDMGKDSLRLLGIFLCGSVGTVVGAMLGYVLLGNFIPELDALAGVFTGTYIAVLLTSPLWRGLQRNRRDAVRSHRCR